MLTVFFDPQIFSLQTFGGISRYYYELINNMLKEENIRVELNMRYSNNLYIKDNAFFKHSSFFPNVSFNWKYNLMEYINILSTIQALIKRNYDLFHPTYYNPYFINLIGRKPFVLTVHDMIHERFEELRKTEIKTSERKLFLSKRASKIIAVSKNTKNDLIKYFHVDPDNIAVIYHGNSIHQPNTNMQNYVSLPEKYILYVGSRKFYKNFIRFIYSVSRILIEDEQLHVLCAGGGEFTSEEISLFEKSDIRRRIHHYSVTDSLLGFLYKNARAFIFPSLYEGFGIPILEAFSCGCPIAISNSSSFPEVAQGAAYYFDPLDELSIRNAILKVTYDNDIREKLITSGYERVKYFSWDKTVAETKKIYQSII